MRCWAWPCMRGILATTCKPPMSSDNKTGPSSESSRTMATMARYVQYSTVQVNVYTVLKYTPIQKVHVYPVYRSSVHPTMQSVLTRKAKKVPVFEGREGKRRARAPRFLKRPIEHYFQAFYTCKSFKMYWDRFYSALSQR